MPDFGPLVTENLHIVETAILNRDYNLTLTQLD